MVLSSSVTNYWAEFGHTQEPHHDLDVLQEDLRVPLKHGLKALEAAASNGDNL